MLLAWRDRRKRRTALSGSREKRRNGRVAGLRRVWLILSRRASTSGQAMPPLPYLCCLPNQTCRRASVARNCCCGHRHCLRWGTNQVLPPGCHSFYALINLHGYKHLHPQGDELARRL